MKFAISFKDLPFQPDRKQVIYIENAYDERVNGFVKKNYEKLSAFFMERGWELVYLPLYFNSKDIVSKVQYYAPYLVSRIKEDESVRSSYVLKFMSHPEEEIMSSLLLSIALESLKENGSLMDVLSMTFWRSVHLPKMFSIQCIEMLYLKGKHRMNVPQRIFASDG